MEHVRPKDWGFHVVKKKNFLTFRNVFSVVNP
jgi:hypothetical protein